MDVVLVVPPGYEGIGSYDRLDYPGLGYLVSYLRNQNLKATSINGATDIIDHKEIAEMIDFLSPKIIGFSVCTEDLINSCKEVLSNLDINPRPLIIVGGHYPTHNSERILDEHTWIDVVIVGEGELTLAELSLAVCQGEDFQNILGTVVRRDGRVFANLKRPAIGELDSLPLPVRDNAKSILNNGGVLCITASRGCFAQCRFCSVSAFYSKLTGPRWRGRSISNIMDEIEYLQLEFGVNHVWFVDDNFLPPGYYGRERVADFVREVKKRQIKVRFSIECRATEINKDIISALKEVGLRRVFIGVESGVQRILNLFEKGVSVKDNIRACRILNDFGICTSIGFIMFVADMSLEEVHSNLLFLKSCHIDGPIPIFTSLQPVTGIDWDWDLVCGSFRDVRVEKIYSIFELYYKNIFPAFRKISDLWWLWKCWLKEDSNPLMLNLNKIMIEANSVLIQAFERSYFLACDSEFKLNQNDFTDLFKNLIIAIQELASIASLIETCYGRGNHV